MVACPVVFLEGASPSLLLMDGWGRGASSRFHGPTVLCKVSQFSLPGSGSLGGATEGRVSSCSFTTCQQWPSALLCCSFPGSRRMSGAMEANSWSPSSAPLPASNCHGHHHAVWSFQLSLPGTVGMGGAEEASSSPRLRPLPWWVSAVLCCFKFLNLLFWGGRDEEGGRCLFLGNHCFCPSYTSGPSVKTAAGLLPTTVLTGAAVDTGLHLQQLSLSFLATQLPC